MKKKKNTGRIKKIYCFVRLEKDLSSIMSKNDSTVIIKVDTLSYVFSEATNNSK